MSEQATSAGKKIVAGLLLIEIIIIKIARVGACCQDIYGSVFIHEPLLVIVNN